MSSPWKSQVLPKPEDLSASQIHPELFFSKYDSCSANQGQDTEAEAPTTSRETWFRDQLLMGVWQLLQQN